MEWRRIPVAELALAGALSALALVIRLPLLTAVPQLTDETGEVATALAILDGARPLVHNDAYRGPVWAYLLAAALGVFGPHPDLPRAFAASLGALTVGATYLLGHAVAGRRAGLMAALLTATAFGPVVLHSHVAWSNHSTPLWVAAAALLMQLGAADGRGSAAALVASGGFWGLALQSHPSAVAPLLGAGAWWLASRDRRDRLRSPAPWLAMILFLAVLSPILVYNVRQPLASVREAGASGQPLAATLQPDVLAGRLVALAGQLGRTVGAGPLAELGDPAPNGLVAGTDGLRPMATLLYAAIWLAALVRAAWRGPRLVGWMGLATLLILPLLNRNYTSFHDQRYVGLLVPLGAVALGAWLSGLWARRLAAGRAALALAVGLLALYPLLAAGAFYSRELAAGRTNAPLTAVVTRMAAGAEPGQHVLVDKALGDVDLGGGGDPARAFVQLLTLSGVANDRSRLDEMRWFLLNDTDTRFWLIVADSTATTLAHEFDLVPWEAGARWRVLERRGQAGG